MAITFNIIYVRNTVELLLPFVCTLLKHSTCHYRLVANGCTPSEVEMLQRFCQQNSRTSFLALSEERILIHGDVLYALLQLEDTPTFAFMDSDIFATGPWLQDHLQALTENSAIFSGLPIWQEWENAVWTNGNPMAGRFAFTKTGRCLGVSFYAIYPRDMVKKCIEKYSIQFTPYEWNELAQPIRQVLDQESLRAPKYDTMKVANILLQREGVSLQYLETSSLTHVGAVSAGSLRVQEAEEQNRQKPLSRGASVIKSFMLRVWFKVLRLFGEPSTDKAVKRSKIRRAAASFLAHLYVTRALPLQEMWFIHLPFSLQSRFKATGSQVLEIYNTYASQMGCPAHVKKSRD